MGNELKNIVNINAGAAVVAGLTYHCFHIPLNYQGVIKHNWRMVKGIPFDETSGTRVGVPFALARIV
jgi:hypothetical protein